MTHDGGGMSDARMFDVAKGVLIATRGCTLDEALAELVEVAQRHRVGVFALARALVALASFDGGHRPDQGACDAAASTWGGVFGRSLLSPAGTGATSTGL